MVNKAYFIEQYSQFVDWKEMIMECGKVLVSNNLITDEYLHSIITTVKKFGPYFVLLDRIALAHSEVTENQVKEFCISWNILDKECNIGFEETKPVKYLIILAAVDNTSHLEFLKQFSKVFSNENLKKDFYKITNKEMLNEFVEKNF